MDTSVMCAIAPEERQIGLSRREGEGDPQSTAGLIADSTPLFHPGESDPETSDVTTTRQHSAECVEVLQR